MAALAGWLLPFPIFSPTLLIGSMLLVSLLCRRRISQHAQHIAQTLTAAIREQPAAGSCAVFVLLVAGMPAWLPVLSADDLASHLQIGWQLQTLGYYRMDVGSQVWALAPWLADVQYGLLQVMAGGEVAPVLNVVWLAITGWLIVRLATTMGLSGALPWLAAMLYVSVPITGALSMSMQTETLTATVVAALALLIARAQATPDRMTLISAAALAGILVGAKVLNLAFAGPLGLFLLWRWRFALPWKALPAALALAVFIGGSSYTYAWFLTGNPVLPLFNDVFGSPWFALENIADQRWQKGLSFATPFLLTFSGNEYYETGLNRGAAGLALIVLFAGCIGAAFDPRTRAMLMVGLAAWLLPLSQIQYLRYTVPALVLLIPVLLVGVATPVWRRTLIVTCAVTVILQLALLPSASWLLASGAIRSLSGEGKATLLKTYAPERTVAQYARTHLPANSRLLFASNGYSAPAELPGQAFVTDWYDFTLWNIRRQREDDADMWSELVEKAGATHIVTRRDPLSAGLQTYLSEQQAILALDVGHVAWLYELPQRRLAGVIDNGSDAVVSVRFPSDTAGARVVDARVVVACSHPFQPFAIRWWMGANSAEKVLERHAWTHCPASGNATLELSVAAPEGSNMLQFSASRLDVAADQSLKVTAADYNSRLDLARGRELSRRVRAVACRVARRLCRVDGPLVSER